MRDRVLFYHWEILHHWEISLRDRVKFFTIERRSKTIESTISQKKSWFPSSYIHKERQNVKSNHHHLNIIRIIWVFFKVIQSIFSWYNFFAFSTFIEICAWYIVVSRWTTTFAFCHGALHNRSSYNHSSLAPTVFGAGGRLPHTISKSLSLMIFHPWSCGLGMADNCSRHLVWIAIW